MKARKRFAVVTAGLLVVLAGGLAVWRLWPHSFENVMKGNEDAITSMSCSAVRMGGFTENGEIDNHVYTLREAAPDCQAFGEVMTLLSQAEFQQDFQNLLPWGIDAAGSEDITLTLTFSFDWEGSLESGSLTLDNKGLTTVSLPSQNGMKLYHITNQELLEELASAIQANCPQEE